MTIITEYVTDENSISSTQTLIQPGCTDEDAVNYDASASDDDGSCVYSGCTDNTALNYNAIATIDDESCEYCTSGVVVAYNIDPEGTGGPLGTWPEENSWSITDCDGVVLVEGDYTTAPVCIELPAAYTVNLSDSYGDGWNGNTLSIDGVSYDGTDLWVGAGGYTPESISIEIGTCVPGCIDEDASNYDASANYDDGSCEYLGCTDPTALNYDASAITDDDSCEYPVPGCTYPTACNYDVDATTDDGSCDFTDCAGCTYADASNYDTNAVIDDGTCIYPENCYGDINADGIVNATDLLAFLGVFGTICDDGSEE